jgi:hypothetical protein
MPGTSDRKTVEVNEVFSGYQLCQFVKNHVSVTICHQGNGSREFFNSSNRNKARSLSGVNDEQAFFIRRVGRNSM